ncbi:MAG: L-histidine N(alpha)-methyltransferase [Nitrosopumilus sp.]
MNDIVQKNLNYKKFVVDSKLQYFKPHATKIEKTFSEEISSSLSRNSKYIHPKFFYDKKGSDLFEKICLLPEYYPTRTEISILKQIQSELPSFLEGDFRLVELGSGASIKTRLLLDIFTESQDKTEYFPIDISEILTESSEQLLSDYEHLLITGIIDTYEGGLEFLQTFDDKKNLIIFLGSSFGNFSPIDGYKFLEKIYSTMKSGDHFLIGLDLVKDNRILESAYNDSQGITAEFNLNVLSRINDELDADFNLDNFVHHAVYNEKDQRIEMYLKSLSSQSIVISKSNLELKLVKDELIHTEYSHKYTLSQIHDLLDDVGFELKHTWLDEKKYFSLTLVSKN